VSIDDDEIALFRASVGTVRRIEKKRVTPRPGARRAVPLQRQIDDQAVMDELAHGDVDFNSLENGDELQWLQPGMRPRILTRLRRGHWRVQDEIDLHQMTVKAAGASVRTFLAEAERDGLSCVKIIHGKGLRSGPGGPRLKQMTARILSRRDRVIAFASAPHHDGGTGAVYVLLDTRSR
jgi:DNA-nicking Smr family endonuclease